MDEPRGGAPEARIRAIAASSVHRICSGQVVLDLATAVKELVENSLDAGATNVEIKVKEFGSESIEVADNGHGVKPEDYQCLARKHHTSKLTEFSDLEAVNTFGFRGEALSSLCSLSELSVITRTTEEVVAKKLDFDSMGVLVHQEDVARAVGTTVAVRNLFKPLPVRHREFKRNLKREYAKMLSVLQSYAVISEGVRFVCTNHSKQGGRQTVVHTQEGASMHANLVTIFGNKTASSMIPMNENLLDGYVLRGFLSKCSSGSGRAAGDRQFFYASKRPVDLPRFSKVLNEVYKSFNSNQYPSAILDLSLPSGTYDVNVTPDKRKVFLLDEDKLLSSFKDALERLYQPSKYTIPLNDIGLNNYNASKPEGENVTPRRLSQATLSFVPVDGNLHRPYRDNAGQSTEGEDDNDTLGKSTTDYRFPDDLKTSQEEQGFSSALHLPGGRPTYKSCPGIVTPSHSFEFVPSLPDSCEVTVDEAKDMNNNVNTLLERERRTDEGGRFSEPKNHFQASVVNAPYTMPSDAVRGLVESSEQVAEPANTEQVDTVEDKELDGSRSQSQEKEDGVTPEAFPTRTFDHACGPVCHCFDLFNLVKLPGQRPPADTRLMELEGSGEKASLSNPEDTHKTPQDTENNKEAMFSISLDLVEDDRMGEHPTHDQVYVSNHPRADQSAVFAGGAAKQADSVVVFDWQGLRHGKKRLNENLLELSRHHPKKYLHSSLADAENVLPENKQAEAELERVFKKQDFNRMKVVGQFNLGFIICRLGEDLFIVDQHASDEIKNFEKLQRTVVLNKQPLLHPMPLDFSPADEVVVSENLEVFRQNGFEIKENYHAPGTQRWQLESVPFSKNVTFGPEDVYEIASSLRSTGGVLNGQIPRPSKVRAMLAMRACRSSIMIGKALHHEEMKKVVSSLSGLDAPWNCPHGRPTMRHLADLQAYKVRGT